MPLMARFYHKTLDNKHNMYYNVLQRTTQQIQKGDVCMTLSLRLNDDDMQLIKAYADLNGMTVSEVVRRSVMEKIEDEYDLAAYNKAMEEYKVNPKTYSLDEVERELGLK